MSTSGCGSLEGHKSPRASGRHPIVTTPSGADVQPGFSDVGEDGFRAGGGVFVRVLVAEDEEGLAEGLRKGLEAEGFATDIALREPTGCGWLANTPTTRSFSTSCCRG